MVFPRNDDDLLHRCGKEARLSPAFDISEYRHSPPVCSRRFVRLISIPQHYRSKCLLFPLIVMDRPLQRKSSIASFASRMSQRRPVSLLSRQGSIASLRSHRTSRQAIEEARIAYLDTRAKILDAFDVQSRDIRHWSEGVHNLHNPILSANGDIKSDFALLQRIPDETDKADLKRILCMVYGTDKIEMGSETS
jgi:hypothetical protein